MFVGELLAPPVLVPLKKETTEETEEQLRQRVLLRAAELIRIDGFSTNPFGMTKRCGKKHCLLGAVAHAMVENGIPVESGWFMYDMNVPARFIGEPDAKPVYEWNDKGYREACEATHKLEKLASGQKVYW